MDAEVKLLAVDCDNERLDSMVATLRSVGYTTTGAGTFEAARQLLRTQRYDVLITALRLLPYNGLHLVIHSQTLCPETKAIVLVCPWDVGSETEVRRHGAHAAESPVDPDRLLSLVRSVLDGRPVRAAHRVTARPAARPLN
ncbi:MAG: hypothetical protein A3G76_11710 [Acidobacteria bacterium RIFCSPLOWO2_12_FULL_65_11]|nr:MAG: hypothetical protein A3H95_14115 [Acidobacteria bacterium RIFCSPLOWO2_02_FULL_64_15]OFW32061.1 MAG: hypothetical protein A3G76_11710 [Acidobacteria bacterium RIFCSPLOWO2_12_FULL_65_11]